MPREVVHCEILDRVRDVRLPTLLITHEHFAYLGSLAPDALYYYRLGASSVEGIAEILHGSAGDDTFTLPRELAKKILELPVNERDPLWAFLIGYVTHCVVDSIFHPPIYFLTGDYYDVDVESRREVRARHRAFEVYLDSWWGTSVGAQHYDLWHSWKKVSGSLSFARLTNYLQEITKQNPKGTEWRNAFWYMSALQRAFYSKWLGSFMKRARSLFPKLRSSEALFRLGREIPDKIFDEPLRFKNPVTGVDGCATIFELRERSIQECLAVVKQLEPLIGGYSTDVEGAFKGLVGKSLNAGLIGVKKAEMKYFSSPPVQIE